jgi:hypothetical protein
MYIDPMYIGHPPQHIDPMYIDHHPPPLIDPSIDLHTIPDHLVILNSQHSSNHKRAITVS